MATCRSMARPPRCGLGLSLLPAPAANGDGRSCLAASSAHCHAGVIHGVGPQGAGALGVGTAARQRPAIVTGHRHLGREGCHPPRVTKGGHLPVPNGPRGQCDALPTFSAEPWGACSFTRHSSVAAGQQDACASTPVPPAQWPGPVPGPGMGLLPSPRVAEGEWKLQPVKRQRGHQRGCPR